MKLLNQIIEDQFRLLVIAYPRRPGGNDGENLSKSLRVASTELPEGAAPGPESEGGSSRNPYSAKWETPL